MPDLTLWGLFVVASVVLLLTPGPAVLFIVARSVEQGRAAGLVSVLGIHLGTIVHIIAAAVGLSALLVSSALAFAIVKYLGAAYLIWIGIRTLMAKEPDPAAPAVPTEPLRRVFRDGFVVNLFNPKTAIFFLAFLPQFVDPQAAFPLWLQFLVLGTIVNLAFSSADLVTVVLASAMMTQLKRSQRAQTVLRWLGGSVLVGLGAHMATSRN